MAEHFWNEKHALYGDALEGLEIKDINNEQRHERDAAKENDKFKEKYWGKSIQELDLSNCQRCTTSYRLLPEDVTISHLSFLCLSLLLCMVIYMFNKLLL